MSRFSYVCPTRLEMGEGVVRDLPRFLGELSIHRELFVVTDPGVRAAGILDPVLTILREAHYHVTFFDELVQNPRDSDCMRGAEQFHASGAACVLAIGGGSAMDTGKTIALLGRSGGVPADYADGLRPYEQVAPIICVPTTAGTGSEVTRSAVITESSTHRKMTLKHARLRPALAVLDPELTYTVPRSVTAATGVDALVHALEGYTCTVSNPISQALGERAMRMIMQSLHTAVQDGANSRARAMMMEGSLLAGLCFGSADVAAVHCLAEALGGLYDTPHGVANAVFLPHVLRYNVQADLPMHAHLARVLGFATDVDADESAVTRMVEGIGTWTASLGICTLRELPGVTPDDFDQLISLAVANGSTASNVRAIGANGYREILDQAFAQDVHF